MKGNKLKNVPDWKDMVNKDVYQENVNENIGDLMHRLKNFSYKHNQ